MIDANMVADSAATRFSKEAMLTDPTIFVKRAYDTAKLAAAAASFATRESKSAAAVAALAPTSEV